MPLWVTVVSGDDDDRAPVWLEALGCARADGCTRENAVVAQRATVSFVRGRAAMVRLLLARVCAGRSCALSERCAVDTGSCIDADARDEVVPFPGEMPQGGVDAGSAGRDAGFDAGEETGVDAGLEVAVDTGIDVGGLDAGADTGIDTGIDVSHDTGIDTGIDVPRDTGVVPIDSGPRDTGVVPSMDTGVMDTGVTRPPTTITCSGNPSRTCSSDGGLPPCCIYVGPTPVSCGCAMPLFGCLPCN